MMTQQYTVDVIQEMIEILRHLHCGKSRSYIVQTSRVPDCEANSRVFNRIQYEFVSRVRVLDF